MPFSAWLKLWPLALALGSLYAGWTIQGWHCEAGKKAEIEAAESARAEAQRNANWHAEVLEIKLAEMEVKNRDLSGRLKHETRKPDYRCPVPAGGMRLLDAIRTGTDLPAGPDGTVP